MHPAGNSAFTEVCSCGRTFHSPAALTNHQKSCLTSKKRLSTVLSKAQKQFSADAATRKRRLESIGQETTPLEVAGTDDEATPPDEPDDAVSSIIIIRVWVSRAEP